MERLAGWAQSVPEQNAPPLSPPPLAKNPAWYGFNLLEYFSTDTDWMKYFPYKDDGLFLEDDFRWIRDWGFNWVRLPMDYRFCTGPNLFSIDDKKSNRLTALSGWARNTACTSTCACIARRASAFWTASTRP
jgi:hypothetical protein